MGASGLLGACFVHYYNYMCTNLETLNLEFIKDSNIMFKNTFFYPDIKIVQTYFSFFQFDNVRPEDSLGQPTSMCVVAGGLSPGTAHAAALCQTQ